MSQETNWVSLTTAISRLMAEIVCIPIEAAGIPVMLTTDAYREATGAPGLPVEILVPETRLAEAQAVLAAYHDRPAT